MIITEKDKEWWASLNDEQKLEAYLVMKAANKSNADALQQVADHLLGKDWYCMSMDIYGVNKDIVEAIKSDYPNINHNWSNTLKKIKEALYDHFHRHK